MRWSWRRARRTPEPPWKPQYDVLARYNTDKVRGVAHEPEHVAWMDEIQRDYNENYLPAWTRPYSYHRHRHWGRMRAPRYAFWYIVERWRMR